MKLFFKITLLALLSPSAFAQFQLQEKIVSCSRSLIKSQVNGRHSVELANVVLEKMAKAHGQKKELKKVHTFCRKQRKNYPSYTPIYSKKQLVEHLNNGNHGIKDSDKVKALTYFINPKEGFECFKTGTHASAALVLSAGVRGQLIKCRSMFFEELNGISLGAGLGLGTGVGLFQETSRTNATFLPVGIDIYLRASFALLNVGISSSYMLNSLRSQDGFNDGYGFGRGGIVEYSPVLDFFIRPPVVYKKKLALNLVQQAYKL